MWKTPDLNSSHTEPGFLEVCSCTGPSFTGFFVTLAGDLRKISQVPWERRYHELFVLWRPLKREPPLPQPFDVIISISRLSRPGALGCLFPTKPRTSWPNAWAKLFDHWALCFVSISLVEDAHLNSPSHLRHETFQVIGSTSNCFASHHLSMKSTTLTSNASDFWCCLQQGLRNTCRQWLGDLVRSPWASPRARPLLMLNQGTALGPWTYHGKIRLPWWFERPSKSPVMKQLSATTGAARCLTELGLPWDLCRCKSDFHQLVWSPVEAVIKAAGTTDDDEGSGGRAPLRVNMCTASLDKTHSNLNFKKKNNKIKGSNSCVKLGTLKHTTHSWLYDYI